MLDIKYIKGCWIKKKHYILKNNEKSGSKFFVHTTLPSQ